MEEARVEDLEVPEVESSLSLSVALQLLSSGTIWTPSTGSNLTNRSCWIITSTVPKPREKASVYSSGCKNICVALRRGSTVVQWLALSSYSESALRSNLLPHRGFSVCRVCVGFPWVLRFPFKAQSSVD